jgi:hypothetical protein
MARIEQSVEIHAPVEKVFDFVVSAWEKDMNFFEGIYDWQPVLEGRMGDNFQIAYKMPKPDL